MWRQLPEVEPVRNAPVREIPNQWERVGIAGHGEFVQTHCAEMLCDPYAGYVSGQHRCQGPGSKVTDARPTLERVELDGGTDGVVSVPPKDLQPSFQPIVLHAFQIGSATTIFYTLKRV